MKRMILAGAICAAGSAAPAFGQELNFRFETSEQAFTPLQSYVAAELGDQRLFFTGITGFGLHQISQPKGPAPIFATASDYNQAVVIADESDGTVTSGSVTHLPDAVRNALLVTNAAAFQRGDTLYMYGGYGPTLDETDVVTKGLITEIDLVAVRDAVIAGTPIPASAFTVSESAAANRTGGEIFALSEDRFVLYGGKIFQGDYPLHTYEEYRSDAFVYDLTGSATVAVQEVTAEEEFSQTVMQRRDLNGEVAMVPDGAGGETCGFIVTGGVFKFGGSYFDTPVSWMEGDAYADEDTTVSIKMNLYHGPRMSFYSDSAGANRIVLFGGITAFDTVDSVSPNFFLPWSDTVTENEFDGTVFVEERDLGSMPNPISNGELIVDERLPHAENGQVLFDQLPPSEILYGKIWGGIHAAEAANEPTTWASGDVVEVYGVKGVRGDISGNGVTDSGDLGMLLAAWGGDGYNQYDLNWNGEIESGDLGLLLAAWGSNTPG